MYPYELFFGITLYEVMIVVGYLAAILFFRRYSEKIGMSAKLYNLALGHGFGRIGCLMAGCCHGLPSEHGIYFPELGYKAIPTQLYEAIFLFILAAVLWRLVTRTRGISPAVYFIAYGVFRFTLEFWRGDDRGKTVIDFLTPSQLVSVLLVITGITLLLTHRRREGKRDKT